MNRGFSLVELILALLIFQVGILGAAGMMILAQRSMARAELRVRAVLESEWVADSLAGSGSGGPGVAARPWGEIEWGAAKHGAGGLQVVARNAQGDTLANLLVFPPSSQPILVPNQGGD